LRLLQFAVHEVQGGGDVVGVKIFFYAYRFYQWLPRDFGGVGAEPGFPYDGGISAGIGFYRVCKWTGVLNPAVKAGKAVLGLCGAAAGATSRAQPPPGRAP